MIRSECVDSCQNASPTRANESEHSDGQVHVRLNGRAKDRTIVKNSHKIPQKEVVIESSGLCGNTDLKETIVNRCSSQTV